MAMPDWIVPLVLVMLAIAFVGWILKSVVWARIVAGDGAYGTIEGYVGKPGQGKTTLGVDDAIGRARIRNAYLVSNIPITYAGLDTLLLPVDEDGIDVGWLVTLALKARSEGRGIVLFLDEVGVWMPARLWQAFGIALMWLFQQSRKLTVEMRWTAQSAKFVDAQLRELTAAVHSVTATPPATVGRRFAGKRPWWMNVKTYDDADHIGSVDHLVADSSGIFGGIRYNKAHEAHFDTDAMVLPPAKLKGAEVLLEAIRRAIAEDTLQGITLSEAETVLGSA